MPLACARRTIERRSLIEPGMLVLVACSGGPDSAALLGCLARLAAEMGFSVAAASVDHGLRAEAGADVAVAARQAAQVGVPFHRLQVEVATGPSVQAQARTARYTALLALAAQLGAQRVAVGHTRDDQAETVLLRLLRGSGVRGLGAVSPHRPDGVIRPLIDCDRATVRAFAETHFSEIAYDPSNTDLRFERIWVRTELLPALAARDPAVVQHLAQLSDDAREHTQLVDLAVPALLGAARVDAETLRISVLQGALAALRLSALRHFIEDQPGPPLARAHLEQLDRAVLRGRGEVWLPAQRCALVTPDGLLRLRTGRCERVPRHGLT